MLNANLAALADKVGRMLATKPEYLVTHPAELHVVGGMPEADLRAFARDHGWRVVRRLGGRQIEFYADVTAWPEG